VDVEIVSHCYSESDPCYAVFLDFQLSSILLNPSSCKVQMTVCCTPSDERTQKVLEFFKNKLNLKIIELSVEKLGRRSVGRNMAAKQTEANFVWFADTDYLFGDNCLDTLVEYEWEKKRVLVYPRKVRFHKRHELGDSLVKQHDGTVGIFGVNEDEFVTKTNKMAWGGIQIARGDHVRKHGYLDGFQKFMKGAEKPFADFRDDVRFRKCCEKKGITLPLRIPNLYRLRHSYISCRRRPGHVPLNIRD